MRIDNELLILTHDSTNMKRIIIAITFCMICLTTWAQSQGGYVRHNTPKSKSTPARTTKSNASKTTKSNASKATKNTDKKNVATQDASSKKEEEPVPPSSTKDNTATTSSNEKTTTQPSNDETIYDIVDQMPSFPGGQTSLFTYISQNIKYPVVAEENGVQGRVICTFVVEHDGSITNVKVIRGVDPSLDWEAIRLIKNMPKWIPGKKGGKAVRVKYTIPITFRLN